MIEDNTGGIEPQYLNKIFEPYFSTKEKSDGIGLYIAKTIIEKEMGGTLKVSNSKKGAICIIAPLNHKYACEILLANLYLVIYCFFV